ncbi:MAG: hypothetical protein FGM46_02095 [Ferruginibacter sp.]|nr:hypothetical protein [Ferruginibacter sp.]
MKKIKTLQQLHLEKIRLNTNKSILILKIKNEWEEIKKGNKPLNLAGQFVSGIISQTLFQNTSQAYITNKASLVAIHLIKEFTGNAFKNLKHWWKKKK